MHGPLGLGLIGGIADNADRLGGVEHTHKMTALGSARVVDNNDCHVTDKLGIIDQSIDQRIDRRERQKEKHDSLIAENVAELTAPDPKQTDEPARQHIQNLHHGT